MNIFFEMHDPMTLVLQTFIVSKGCPTSTRPTPPMPPAMNERRAPGCLAGVAMLFSSAMLTIANLVLLDTTFKA